MNYICILFKKKFMKIFFLTLLLVIPAFLFSQKTSQDVTKDKDKYVFAQIYAGFYFSFKDIFKPQAAFQFNQGIIGYYHKISDNVSGKIMYDVTRTTHFYEITDTAGNKLDYKYFEGSKYTSYLKMAEIKWSINDNFDFRVGQLLSTQYLTFQDKFWGFRYIDVTFQEKYRFGMPADFGVQLDFKYKDKFLNQFSIVNGEGPFRYQDMNAKFLYSNNMQFNPIKDITLKLYVDYAPSPDTGSNKDDKSVISVFAGYKTKKYRIGFEYNYVSNYNYNMGTDYSGMSVYGAYRINYNIVLLGRYDYLFRSTVNETTNVDYYILGFQYEPAKKFTTSINFRYYSIDALPFIYANFGLKF